MGLGMRQWKALMKKNYINWKRSFGCSFFEICCPAVVMFIMVSLRGVVDVTTVPVDQLLKVKQATFPGAVWTWNDKTAEACAGQDDSAYGRGTYGTWNFYNTKSINDDVQDFFEYDEYPVLNPTTPTYQYDLKTDFQGPFFFIP